MIFEVRRWDAAADEWVIVGRRFLFERHALNHALDVFKKYPSFHLALFKWQGVNTSGPPSEVMLIQRPAIH